MKNILVVLHLYYKEQTEYFISKLSNITGVSWDLIITHTGISDSQFDLLKRFKPNTRFIETENYGYDVWPFLKVIKMSDLDKYDYVIKLHTKRSIDNVRLNHYTMNGYTWRNVLVDSILYSPSYFNGILKKFGEHPEIGMISAFETYTDITWVKYSEVLTKELEKFGLTTNNHFMCMGTMFMIRANLLKVLQTDQISLARFMDHDPESGLDFTLAHVYERLLSLLPAAQGYKLFPETPNKKLKYRLLMRQSLSALLKFLFCIERKPDNDRKFIRVLGFEFYLEPQRNDDLPTFIG